MRDTDYEFDYPEPDELEPDDEFLDIIEDTPECRKKHPECFITDEERLEMMQDIERQLQEFMQLQPF